MHINTLEKLWFHLNNDRQLLSGLHLYLLFDSSLHSELNSSYFLLDDTPEYYPLFLNTHLEEHLHCSPYLVKITTGSPKFIEWFFTNSKQWGFFYFSEHSLEDALQHWQTILFSKQQNILLRFYDPKILQAMINNQRSQIFTTTLKPCKSLYFQDTSNQWMKLIPEKNKENTNNVAPQDQDSPLYTNAISKRCELVLWDQSPRLMEKFSPHNLEVAVQQGVAIALKSGFTQKNSILTFLRLWLERGPKNLSSRETLGYLMTPTVSYKEKILYLKENTSIEDTWNHTPNPPIII